MFNQSNRDDLSIFLNPAGFNHDRGEWFVPEIKGGRDYSEACHILIQEEGDPDYHIFAYVSRTSAAFVAVRGYVCAVLKTKLPVNPERCMQVAMQLEIELICWAHENIWQAKAYRECKPFAERFIRLSEPV